MNDLITIVDEENNVVGSTTRQEAQLKGLWHRIVVVLVFNSQGQLFIQKRSPHAETSPNMWDHSAAGHVDADILLRREIKQRAPRRGCAHRGLDGIKARFGIFVFYFRCRSAP